jgi:hypothetical protein
MRGSNPELAVFTTYFGEARGTTNLIQREYMPHGSSRVLVPQIVNDEKPMPANASFAVALSHQFTLIHSFPFYFEISNKLQMQRHDVLVLSTTCNHIFLAS